MLRLSGVNKTYEGKYDIQVLTDIHLTIEKGEMAAIMGPSGSGKSTLLNLMGGLDVPTSGSVAISGRDISKDNEKQRSMFRRENVSYIFQAYHLMPTLTVSQNVALPLHLAGVRRKEIEERVTKVITEVGLEKRAQHIPDELSGGERQRVAIARALVTGAPLLLADEPTGNLDTTRGEEILNLLKAINSEHGTTIVMVTHDPHAASACRRLIRLRDGRVEDNGENHGGDR